jgi:hypothetical protein
MALREPRRVFIFMDHTQPTIALETTPLHGADVIHPLLAQLLQEIISGHQVVRLPGYGAPAAQRGGLRGEGASST